MKLPEISEMEVGAWVYFETKNPKGTAIYYLKLYLPSLGLILNDLTARMSPKFPERGWWIQGPACPQKFKPHFEFVPNSPFKLFMEEIGRSAVDLWLGLPIDERLDGGNEKSVAKKNLMEIPDEIRDTFFGASYGSDG